MTTIALNLRDTFVPHFLRSLDETLLAQESQWGYWRDWWFQLYQLNLFFAFGSIAGLVITCLLVLRTVFSSDRVSRFWTAFVAGVIFLGVSAHGTRDYWGVAHICLQPLIILGLTFLAAKWASLASPWRVMLFLGMTADLVLGIALHFGVESFALDRWLTPGRSLIEITSSYSTNTQMNLAAKIYHHVEFLGEAMQSSRGIIFIVLVTVLIVAIRRASRSIHPVR